MKTRTAKFTLKGKNYEYKIATFDTLKEAQSMLGEDLLNVINLGNAVYAKALELGRNPFKPRKTRAKLDLTKLDAATLQKLKDVGAIL